ncbi:MAG: hypothetical protein J0H51_01930 [Rhizobiales bacterium]|nr:hypothetical protein [Hyphomicrobiales bacterium]
MTAEIAILNKPAAALAADSAVTIGRHPNTKIYNTVNKIFELSTVHPVGVMIYGRLDFMGLPIETIIKQYRRKLGHQSFSHVKGYKDDFLNYLRSDVPYSPADEATNVAIIATDFFTKAHNRADKLILDDIRSHGRLRRGKINGLTQSILNKEIADLKAKPFAPSFNRVKVPTRFEGVIADVAKDCLKNNMPNGATLKLTTKYAGYFLAKSQLSSYRSGLVFTGFGEDELCPSLEAVEIDGIVDGKLKFVEKTSIDIGRNGPSADILGFAQDDMVQSFLHGVDPLFRSYVKRLLGDVIKDISALTLGVTLNDKAKVDAALSALQPDFDKMQRDFTSKADQYIDSAFTSQIKEMIRSMPVQEIATLAASLIEITSLKRKVSRAQETVGGDVDVAILSKSEGFVWTKRKHYFPPELNPRFFVRHYNQPKK